MNNKIQEKLRGKYGEDYVRCLLFTMFGSFLMYIGTVINFHRGSSKGSNEKQELINQFKGKV